MRLYEHAGKELFRQYGISTPKGVIISAASKLPRSTGACVIKAQVMVGDRQKAGGIVKAENYIAAKKAAALLIGSTIRDEKVGKVLVEELILYEREYYLSFSYDSSTRSPVLALNAKGGTGIEEAHVFPIDLLWGLPKFFVRNALLKAAFPIDEISGISKIIEQLWKFFLDEHALLAEINPLFKTVDGYIAGDAKIILDDEKLRPAERHYIDMEGDIAILASGGGASMLNMDALLRAGGKPANYTEYSGNPPAEVVRELTKRVLSKKNLKGCWVVGAAANFTDIHTTLSGFLDGLREINPKPRYPIVIRRDGPRCQEAFAMLREAGLKEGYDFHLYDSNTPMVATAKTIVDLAYATKKI